MRIIVNYVKQRLHLQKCITICVRICDAMMRVLSLLCACEQTIELFSLLNGREILFIFQILGKKCLWKKRRAIWLGLQSLQRNPKNNLNYNRILPGNRFNDGEKQGNNWGNSFRLNKFEWSINWIGWENIISLKCNEYKCSLIMHSMKLCDIIGLGSIEKK